MLKRVRIWLSLLIAFCYINTLLLLARRDYRNRDGDKLPGVTTVLDRVLAKPALVWWGFEQGQLYERGEISGLYEKRDKAGDAGTLAHLMVECHVKGDPEPPTNGYPPDVLDKAESCFLAFLEWERAHSFQMVESELEMVSEKHQYGGTIDIGAIVGELGIVDIKTSKDVYTSMWVQVAAYGHLWNENYPSTPIRGYHILRLGANGDFSHHYRPTLDDEWIIFRDALEIFGILKATKQKL